MRKFLINLVVSPETLLEYRTAVKENCLFKLEQEEENNNLYSSKVTQILGKFIRILEF